MTGRESPPDTPLCLGEMHRGQGGYICRVEGPEATVRRLLEMGMVEEAYVEIVHEAPFGRDPVAVRVRGGLLALRRQEAACVTIRKA
ncbi:MAG: ferrous iron transport protein A [Deltaproteobacteria bacterium]|nr:ferrous iron transport protein A [Deltaproteobacteria bacterium]